MISMFLIITFVPEFVPDGMSLKIIHPFPCVVATVLLKIPPHTHYLPLHKNLFLPFN